MDERSFHEILFTPPALLLPILAVLLVFSGSALIGDPRRSLHRLGLGLLQCAAVVGVTIGIAYVGFNRRFDLERQVVSSQPVGAVRSVRVVTAQTFVVDAGTASLAVEGRPQRLQAGDALTREVRGNGRVALCRAAGDERPRCWWQVLSCERAPAAAAANGVSMAPAGPDAPGGRCRPTPTPPN